MNERPYPDGIAWDEAWRQRQRADAAEIREQKDIAEIQRLNKECIRLLEKLNKQSKNDYRWDELW